MVGMHSKRNSDSDSALSINSMGNKTHKNCRIVTCNKNCKGVLSLPITTTIE